MKRRDFLKTAAAVGAAGLGTGLMSGCSGSGTPERFNFNRLGTGGGLKLSFYPYELQLRHTFTVSSYSRKTTPGVQVCIEYEGVPLVPKHPTNMAELPTRPPSL